MGLWSTLGSIGGSLFGPAGSVIGGSVGNHFDGKEKVPGVPTPQMGSEVGQNRLAEMDAAFPGTTAWERLGSSSNQAGVPSAESTSRSAAMMQSRDLSNRSSIADSTNRAHILAAAGGTSPMAASSLLDMYNRGSGGHYDTATSQRREALPSEIQRNVSESGGQIGKAAQGISNVYERFGKPFVRLGASHRAALSKFAATRRKPF